MSCQVGYTRFHLLLLHLLGPVIQVNRVWIKSACDHDSNPALSATPGYTFKCTTMHTTCQRPTVNAESQGWMNSAIDSHRIHPGSNRGGPCGYQPVVPWVSFRGTVQFHLYRYTKALGKMDTTCSNAHCCNMRRMDKKCRNSRGSCLL